jgi:PAS domain S-box-containing protein
MSASHAQTQSTSASAQAVRASARPRWLHLVLFLGFYVVLCGFAKWVAVLPDTGISIWPPAGLFIATLILSDEREWLWWAIVALAAELLANLLWFHNALAVAVLLAAGNLLCAVAGAWLVKRYGQGPVRLESLRDVLGLVVLGALVAPVIAATVGATTLAWSEGQPFAKAWTLWWIGDATGVLLVAPLVLIGLQSWQDRGSLSTARLGEAALLALVLSGVAVLVLGGPLPFAYLVMPPLLWAAIRFEFRGVIAALVLLALISAIYARAGAAQWVIVDANSPSGRHLMLQLFLAVSALSALVVAAIARQHRSALQALRSTNQGLEHHIDRRGAELYRSEQRFRALAETVPVIVWVTDAQGSIEFVNREYEHFFGVLEKDVQKSDWQALLHPDDAAAYLEAFGSAQRERREFSITARVRRLDGTWCHVATRGVPRFSESDECIGMVVSSHDVSNRIKQEEALAATARQKDEFLAMLAHELRNPLAPIRNAVHLLAARPLTDPLLAGACGVLERQSAQLERLVDDLLDVSRVATGKVLLRLAKADAVGFVEAGMESAQPLADAKGQQLTLHGPEPGMLFVDGDAARLIQAVGNIVGNAVKYCGEGGRVDVHLRVCEALPDTLEIAVTDNGPGIDSAVLPHVFELFVQGETSIARASGGLGIGLAMVRKLVELHGGSVTAHSDGPGLGARFVMRLPMVAPPIGWANDAANKGANSAAPSPGPPMQNQAPVVSARNVLVVDDNQDAADSLAMVLQLDHHEVTVCRDGTSGLAMAQAQAFDVVLLDLGLPDLDGFAVAQGIRAAGASRDARLIACTGYGQPEDRARTAAAGFDAHVIKPMDPAALCDLVRAPDANFTTLLARRIDDARLLRLLDAWRGLREPSRLPAMAALLDASQAVQPWRAVAAVESLSPEFAMRFIAAGPKLEELLGTQLPGPRLSDADTKWGSLESAYRAVALNGQPGLDRTELRFGPGDVLHFKRLIVPVGSGLDLAVTHLVSVVLFDPAEAVVAGPTIAKN